MIPLLSLSCTSDTEFEMRQPVVCILVYSGEILTDIFAEPPETCASSSSVSSRDGSRSCSLVEAALNAVVMIPGSIY
jgi:hypothetical protein